jgi:hypothetical protein
MTSLPVRVQWTAELDTVMRPVRHHRQIHWHGPVNDQVRATPTSILLSDSTVNP